MSGKLLVDPFVFRIDPVRLHQVMERGLVVVMAHQELGDGHVRFGVFRLHRNSLPIAQQRGVQVTALLILLGEENLLFGRRADEIRRPLSRASRRPRP